MTPCAPASSARLICHSESTGMRMIGLAPDAAMWLASCHGEVSGVHCTTSIDSHHRSSRHCPSPPSSPGPPRRYPLWPEKIPFYLPPPAPPPSLPRRDAHARRTHRVVVRVSDQTVLGIHEHPVEAPSSEDGLGDGRVGEAEAGQRSQRARHRGRGMEGSAMASPRT